MLAVQGEEQGLRFSFVSQNYYYYFVLLFLTSLFRGKRSCVECTGLKRKCGMTEKESQKSSTRRTTTKRKRADDDDGDDDDEEERPRSMRLGEIVDRLETYTERAEALDKKLEERRVAEKEWWVRVMNGIDTSNSYVEALKHNTNFLYGEVRGTRG